MPATIHAPSTRVGRANGLCHDGGLEENAGTDGDPDDQRSCMDQRQPTAGLERGGAHRIVFQRARAYRKTGRPVQ